MEELSQLSPASREATLEALPRKELQQLAKETGIKGNSKSKDIVQSLLAILDGNRSATDAEAGEDTENSSSLPVSSGDQQIPESRSDPGCSTSGAGEAEAAAAVSKVASENVTDTAGLEAGSFKQLHSNDETVPAAQSSADEPEPGKQQEADRLPSAFPAAKCSTSTQSDLEPADAPQGSTVASSQQPAAEQPVAVAAQTAPDCISNPLYEEPSASDLAPAAAATFQPVVSVGAQAQSSAGCDTDTLAAQAAASRPLCTNQSVATAVAQQPGAVVALSNTPLAAPDGRSANLTADAEAVNVAAADSLASLNQAGPPQDTALGQHDTAEGDMSFAASDGASATQELPAKEGVHRGVREPTPEDVANLGKAVAVVQARSCQLSPSLLTLQSSADLGSPANDAFERGRKSGIWQGATEVELRQLERQWDDYKSVATRGWELPSLQDVQAKSDALTASGFASVGSPVISNSMREAMAKQGLSGKRKARSEEEQAPARRSNSARKVVKRAPGLTPSRKATAQQGTPLRGSRAGPSRLALTTNAADLENTGKAANAASTPQGKASIFGGALPATPFSMGTTQKTAGHIRGSKVSAIPKPRVAGDRAKKAEAVFAARRAAALAKGKK